MKRERAKEKEKESEIPREVRRETHTGRREEHGKTKRERGNGGGRKRWGMGENVRHTYRLQLHTNRRGASVPPNHWRVRLP